MEYLFATMIKSLNNALTKIAVKLIWMTQIVIKHIWIISTTLVVKQKIAQPTIPLENCFGNILHLSVEANISKFLSWLRLKCFKGNPNQKFPNGRGKWKQLRIDRNHLYTTNLELWIIICPGRRPQSRRDSSNDRSLRKLAQIWPNPH